MQAVIKGPKHRPTPWSKGAICLHDMRQQCSTLMCRHSHTAWPIAIKNRFVLLGCNFNWPWALDIAQMVVHKGWTSTGFSWAFEGLRPCSVPWQNACLKLLCNSAKHYSWSALSSESARTCSLWPQSDA